MVIIIKNALKLGAKHVYNNVFITNWKFDTIVIRPL